MFWHQWVLLSLTVVIPRAVAQGALGYDDDYDTDYPYDYNPGYYHDSSTSSTKKHYSKTSSTSSWYSSSTYSTSVPTSTSSSYYSKSSSSSSSTYSTSVPTSSSSSYYYKSSTSSKSKPTTDMTTKSTVTSVMTLTAFVTLSSTFPQADVLGPIRGLPQCAQNVVFDSLSASSCNPANFPCICNELDNLRVRDRVVTVCGPAEIAQYDAFVAGICPNNRRPDRNTTTTVPTIRTLPTTTRSKPPLPITTGKSNVTTTPIGPFVNTSMPISIGTGIPPISYTTSPILIPTTDSNGNPTTLVSATVIPVPPTQASPPGPQFTGAAAAVEAPKLFGTLRAIAVGGAIGLMGLVFAEL